MSVEDRRRRASRFFFFQAEDGIRDLIVTGVQTCALPIYALVHQDPAAAITELRELAALAPDFQMCHQSLGIALYQIGRYQEAEKEYRIAAEIGRASCRERV